METRKNESAGMALVSVVIPVYNGAQYIEQTLNNILEQTYQNIEVVLINDGSTDNSQALLEQCAENDQRIKVFQQKNQGIAGARNFGIEKAQGEFVAFCDQDDLWHEDKLTQQMPLFNNAKVGLVHCGGSVDKVEQQQLSKLPLLTDSCAQIFEKLVQNNFISCISTVVRKSLLLQVQGFDPDKQLMGVDDWHLWLKLSLICDVGYVAEHLYTHIIHGDNFSRKERLMHHAEIVCLNKTKSTVQGMGKKINWQAKISEIHQRYAKSYINDGDFEDARQAYKKSIFNKPWQLNSYIRYLLLTVCPYSWLTAMQKYKRK